MKTCHEIVESPNDISGLKSNWMSGFWISVVLPYGDTAIFQTVYFTERNPLE